MGERRQQSMISNNSKGGGARKVINEQFSYNPLVDPPGYGSNDGQQHNAMANMPPGPQYQQQAHRQYPPADRNYFEQNLMQVNDQMSNINSYNQQAVNHNQMILEMQENKVNSLMSEVKKLKENKQGNGSGALGGKGITRDVDLENIMMLNAFDDTLANTRLFYGDHAYNQNGRYGKVGSGNQMSNPSGASFNYYNNYNNNGFGSNSSVPLRPGNQRITTPSFNASSIIPQQKYRNDVFGGFGELFWDNGQQQQQQQQPEYQQQMPYRMNGGEYNPNNRSMGQIPPQVIVVQPPPPQASAQSVFQRNSSSILNKSQPSYTQSSQRNAPPSSGQKYLNDIPPSKDPLTELLVKQGQMMESMASTIEREGAQQERQERRRLKKKLNVFEQKQKLQLLQDEYDVQKKPTQPHPPGYSLPYGYPPTNYPYGQPYPPQYYDPYRQQDLSNPMLLPLQLLLANQMAPKQEDKREKIEAVKMAMLMRKLALENELLRGLGGAPPPQVKAAPKAKKAKAKSKKKTTKKAKKKNKDEDEEEDFDDDDDYYDSEDDYDDDDYYDDDEEEEPEPVVVLPPEETEEEKKKREDEAVKEAKKRRLEILMKRFRLVVMRAMFPIMYFQTIKYSINQKKIMQYKKMNDDISLLFDYVQQWVQKVCSRGLNLIADTKASLDITKKLSDKEMRKRIDNLKARVKAFLDGLADNCKVEDIGAIPIQIFAMITSSFNFPPQQFLFKFELNRLKYTYYGALNDVNGRQQLMLLLMFIIGRVLILRILFRPWNFSEQIKESADLKLNMKVLQSVIYEILVEYLRNTCPPIQNNQAMLSTEKKIKEIPRIPAATNDPVDPIIYKEAQKNDEPIMLGLFQRSQLDPIFSGAENAAWQETMKSTIQGLGESLVATVSKKYEEMRAQQKAENANKKGISSMLGENMADRDFMKKMKQLKDEEEGKA